MLFTEDTGHYLEAWLGDVMMELLPPIGDLAGEAQIVLHHVRREAEQRLEVHGRIWRSRDTAHAETDPMAPRQVERRLY